MAQMSLYIDDELAIKLSIAASVPCVLPCVLPFVPLGSFRGKSLTNAYTWHTMQVYFKLYSLRSETMWPKYPCTLMMNWQKN